MASVVLLGDVLDFLVDYVHVKFGDEKFRQEEDIRINTNLTLLTDSFLCTEFRISDRIGKGIWTEVQLKLQIY